MQTRSTVAALVAPVALVAVLAAPRVHADETFPPWSDSDDIPIPAWAHSVEPRSEAELQIFRAASVKEPRRGSAQGAVRLPLFGARRGPGCEGRWLLVGPMAWVCGDAVNVLAEEPTPSLRRVSETGLLGRYFFVGSNGAPMYTSLDRVGEDAPDQDLEAGFAVAIREERVVEGERYGRTSHDRWVPMSALGAARPSAFHGVLLADDPDALSFAWIAADAAAVFDGPEALGTKKTGKKIGTRNRFERVAWREQREVGKPTKNAPASVMVRISDDSAPKAEWIAASDLARPTRSMPPDEVDAKSGEHWIDVDIASQTVVAYEGATPVYATLASTGRGAQGSDTATPRGVHRVWAKLITSDMGNVERDDGEEHYSIEDVPYVQFFDKGIALHGAFWHRDFGRARSHGCVNLAPKDAEWLFAFSGPKVPSTWTAALPTALEPGTWVRVR